MLLSELKALKIGTVVRMGRYHWVMEGHNSLNEPVFHRVDDNSVKLLDTVFIAHLITLADDGYEYQPPKVSEKSPATEPEVPDDVEEIQIQQPKKKRGRPRKPK